jgi:hypothetical protein
MADYPETFKFTEATPQIVGIIVLRKTLETKYGEREVLTLDTDGTRRDVFCTQAALKKWLKDSQPREGDGVEIVFLGEEAIYNDDGERWITSDGNPGVRKLFKARILTSASVPAALPPLGPTSDPDDIPFAPSFA